MTIHNADRTLFSKIYLAANNRKDSALEKEESQALQTPSQESTTASAKDTTKTSIKAKISDDSAYQLVLFEDGVNGGKVQALLSKANVQRLQEKFDEGDFYARSDGALRLNGKAEAYVSGWYGEIAYNMGAFKADLNQDGKFSAQESALIKDDYTFEVSEKSTIYGDSINLYGVQSYVAQTPQNQQTQTLDDLLDSFISADMDLNGKVTLKEHLETTEGSVYRAIREILDSQASPLEGLAPTQEIKERKKGVLEDISKQEAMALLAKIKQNGDLESLSPKEREALQKYFSNEVQKIKQEKGDSELKQEHFLEAVQNFIDALSSQEGVIFRTRA